jgi:hypothetical protein
MRGIWGELSAKAKKAQQDKAVEAKMPPQIGGIWAQSVGIDKSSFLGTGLPRS